MPLDQALAAVAEQADDARAEKIVGALRNAHRDRRIAARGAGPLSADLRAAVSRPGRGRQRVGTLPEVLARLADYLEARAALRQKFTTALIYPMLVTAIALGVIVVLLTYVVPQVVAVYQQSRQTLPWLTRALIATSEFFRATGWFWLAAFAAALVAFVVAIAGRRFARAGTRGCCGSPGVGRLLRSLDTARFASTLAILVGSGAPMLRSLEAAGDVVRMMPLARLPRTPRARWCAKGSRCPARSRSRRCFLRC